MLCLPLLCLWCFLHIRLSGQVIIDKNQGITCAVNKINIIDSMYRNFEMELLAGDGANMITKVLRLSIVFYSSKKNALIMQV